MADNNRKTVVTQGRTELRRSESSRSTSSTASATSTSRVPLAALLPKLGSLNTLATFSQDFSARLVELQAQQAGSEEGGENAQELRKRRAIEESMLNQALQWLSIQSSRE